jgi:ribosome-binding factor A
MKPKRTDRLNSLLKEVISEVITKDVDNSHVCRFFSVTKVDVSPDLHTAKVYVSVIGSEAQKKETIVALDSAAHFIASIAKKKIIIRYFPALSFHLDSTVDEQMKIEKILEDLKKNEKSS